MYHVIRNDFQYDLYNIQSHIVQDVIEINPVQYIIIPSTIENHYQ